jgi:hypothetical protein
MSEIKVTEELTGVHELFRVLYHAGKGTHEIQIGGVPGTADPGVIGLILVDALRVHAGLYEEIGICSRAQAETRIKEVLLAELAHPTNSLKEFVRPKGDEDVH